MSASWTVTAVVQGGKTRGLRYACYLLTVIRGPDRRRQKKLLGARALLGTGPGADLMLTDRTVSAAHCELLMEPEGVRVRDLGSKNGVYVEGLRVQDAWVGPGDRLQLGETVLRLKRLDESQDQPLDEDASLGKLRGSSIRMRQLYSELREAARADAPVLLVGESGTGKELAAEALHLSGPRRSAPFVVVDCASLAPGLVESILFGHEEGAFTGATGRSEGLFVQAHGGTLFLDELHHLPAAVQSRLLGVLERGAVQPLGGRAPIPVDVRVVAATHPELERAVNRGTFRADLFFRLAVLVVRLPSLREHPEDIPELIGHFLEELGGATLSPGILHQLSQRDFPGNVRELRNAVARAAAGFSDAPSSAPAGPVTRPDLALPLADQKKRVVEAFERAYLKEMLEATQGNVAEAARRAGVNRVHLYEMLERLGLSPRGR